MNNTRYEIKMTDGETLFTIYCHQDNVIQEIYECGSGYYILETDVDVEIPRKLYEKLEEIQAICVGADSPDAHEHAERDPIEELQCCQQDIGAISNIVEEIQQIIGE